MKTNYLFLAALILLAGCKGEYYAEKDFYRASKVLKQAEKTGNYDEAIRAFEKVADNNPATLKAPQSLLIAAELKIKKKKDYEGARQTFTKVVRTYNKQGTYGVDAQYRIAELYELEGKWDKAEGSYWNTAEYYTLRQKGLYAPIQVLLHYKRSKDRAGANRTFIKAKEHYESVLKSLGPIQASAMVKNYEALAYLVHGNWRKANDIWLAIAKEMPDQPSAPVSILAAADTLALNGEAEAAIGLYRRYLRQYPNHSFAGRTLVRIGVLQQKAKHFDLARRLYNRALKQYVKGASKKGMASELILLIGDSYKEQGIWTEAEKIYKAVQETYPTSNASAQVPFRFYEHYKSIGQMGQADSILNEAMGRYRQLAATHAGTAVEATAIRFLHAAYVTKKDWQGLLAYIDEEIKKEKSQVKQGRWLILKAMIIEKRLKDREKALVLYQDFLKQFPDHPLANTAKQHQQILTQN